MAKMNSANRTPDQLREHYVIEKELGNRLRNATREERRRLYNQIYDERIARIPHHPLLTQALDPEAQARAAAPQVRLLRYFVKPDSTFLEIGPGDCAVAFEIAKYVKKVFAVDVSEKLVQGSVRPENFELLLSDGIELPVPKNSVHVAYSNQVIEHLHPDDVYDQLHNLWEALAPGGIYICITPNRLSGPWDISRHFDPVATGLHLKEFTITELAALFEKAGFSRVRTFISYQGYKMSPVLHAGPIILVEWSLQKLPRGLSKRSAKLLTAVKVVAQK